MRAFAKLQNHYHQYWYCCPKPKTKKCFYSFWWQGTLWAKQQNLCPVKLPPFSSTVHNFSNFHPWIWKTSKLFSNRKHNPTEIFPNEEIYCFRFLKYISVWPDFNQIWKTRKPILHSTANDNGKYCDPELDKKLPPLSPPKEAKWLSQDRLSTHSRRRES